MSFNPAIFSTQPTSDTLPTEEGKDAMEQYLLSQPLPGCRNRREESAASTASTTDASVTPATSSAPNATAQPAIPDVNSLRHALLTSFDTVLAEAAKAAKAAIAASQEPVLTVREVAHVSNVVESTNSTASTREAEEPFGSSSSLNTPTLTVQADATKSQSDRSQNAERVQLGDSITIRIQPHRILIQLLEQDMLPIVICGAGRKRTVSTE